MSSARPPLPPDRPQSMLAHADHSGNGSVTMDDFYRLMKKGGGKKNKIDDLLGDDD